MKKALMFGVALAGASVFAEGAGGFDPSQWLSEAQAQVTGIATAVGTVLTAASAIYLAFLGWRKFRDATNKV